MYRKHLTPDLTQLEKCLLRRAAVLEAEAEKPDSESAASILNILAGEFRDLAGELHEL